MKMQEAIDIVPQPLRERPNPTSDDRVTKLSARELEVLRLVTEGCSNPEIAAALFLSPNTVKSHVRSIMNKLAVQHRLQIAVFAVRNNLV